MAPRFLRSHLEQVSLYWRPASCLGILFPFIGTALYSRDASALITTAIQTGITHLDTAEVYKNEASVGNGIAASDTPRSSLFVTTKLFRLAAVPSGSTADGVKAKLLQELHDLQLAYVDLYLWHTPVGHEGNIAEVWKGFELVKKEGLAKHVGVSNFRVRDLEEILNNNPEILPEVNQVIAYLHRGLIPSTNGTVNDVIL